MLERSPGGFLGQGDQSCYDFFIVPVLYVECYFL